MNCIQILEEFVLTNELGIDKIKLVMGRIEGLNESNPDKCDVDYSADVVAATIVDSFKLNAEALKQFSDFCIKKGLQIGRRHKKVLLRFLNYRKEEDREEFFYELQKENPLVPRNELENELEKISINSNEKAFECFRDLWEEASVDEDKAKLGDYLFGLYSKLHAFYNSSAMSNVDLFEYNLPFIKEDLSEEAKNRLKEFCYSSTESFYEEYVTILRKELQGLSLEGKLEDVMNQNDYDKELLNQKMIYDRKGDSHYLLTEEYDAVYLRLNQQVYDSFNSFEEFMNYLLDTIRQAYRVLVNNKVFAVEIDNIYVNDRNIKWLLYAYIGIYGERFIKTKEYRKFFSPEKICCEMLSVYGYKIKDKSQNEILSLLKKYYHKNAEVIEEIYHSLETEKNIEDLRVFLEEWAYVYYGFTFNDCYIIKSDSDSHKQFLDGIKNDNKVLFVFYKYRMDERKTPCPVCNGLNVSGNSYPEVGHRSWECKNVICSSRSKSDRGKRYSFKTNYMQFGAQNLEADNTISKELIAKWRRDIASISTDKDIYYMFIKYFSFMSEKVLFINVDFGEIQSIEDTGREITCFSLLEEKAYHSVKKRVSIGSNYFKDYFVTGNYINRFVQMKKNIETESRYQVDGSNQESYVIQGDSFEVLNKLPLGCVSAAVTSPPYFNAREYSQWENMYLYYIDMFNIARNTLKVLDKGGVFVYNIGDINGNEMTVAKSNMGTKRMLLGAYSILIFEKAGYELVENYIWNKGEPQSKRSTNDGNFTPHYQKPVNCYEHMFVFKRKGEKILGGSQIPEKWSTYITDFLPVYKINCHGENTLGHTAPYPEDIPELSIALSGRSGKYILDPFLGSGTTVIAAIRHGLNGIGIEFSKEYAKLSKVRIEEECSDKTIKLI